MSAPATAAKSEATEPVPAVAKGKWHEAALKMAATAPAAAAPQQQQRAASAAAANGDAPSGARKQAATASATSSSTRKNARSASDGGLLVLEVMQWLLKFTQSAVLSIPRVYVIILTDTYITDTIESGKIALDLGYMSSRFGSLFSHSRTRTCIFVTESLVQ